MTARRILQAWASTTSPSTHAAELIRSGAGNRSLKTDLIHLAEHIESVRFVIAKLHERDLPTLGHAIDSFCAMGSSARLCLAGSRSLLSKVDAFGLDSDHVGLMIDEVDIDTPWADLIWDRIEAVRFGSPLVVRATHDMRTACALESMLAMAREVGLRTLGSCDMADAASVCGHYDFDYLPVAEGAAGDFKFGQALPYSPQAKAIVGVARHPVSR